MSGFRQAHRVEGRDELCTCCGHWSQWIDRTYGRCEDCYAACPAIPHRGACSFVEVG
jgi:hypothetical protein